MPQLLSVLLFAACLLTATANKLQGSPKSRKLLATGYSLEDFNNPERPAKGYVAQFKATAEGGLGPTPRECDINARALAIKLKRIQDEVDSTKTQGYKKLTAADYNDWIDRYTKVCIAQSGAATMDVATTLAAPAGEKAVAAPAGELSTVGKVIGAPTGEPSTSTEATAAPTGEVSEGS